MQESRSGAPVTNRESEEIYEISTSHSAAQTLELVVLFPVGTTSDGPDNITVGPHGFDPGWTYAIWGPWSGEQNAWQFE